MLLNDDKIEIMLPRLVNESWSNTAMQRLAKELDVITDFLPPGKQLLLKKETAEAIRCFRGKLKWCGNLDKLRENKR